MIDDLTEVLARVQSDYGFYVRCQTDPDTALADFTLDDDEKRAITDPALLARLLDDDLRPQNLPSITIKISGRHDWVNRSPKRTTTQEHVDVEIAAVKDAVTDEERRRAALELIERIG